MGAQDWISRLIQCMYTHGCVEGGKLMHVAHSIALALRPLSAADLVGLIVL